MNTISSANDIKNEQKVWEYARKSEIIAAKVIELINDEFSGDKVELEEAWNVSMMIVPLVAASIISVINKKSGIDDPEPLIERLYESTRSLF